MLQFKLDEFVMSWLIKFLYETVLYFSVNMGRSVLHFAVKNIVPFLEVEVYITCKLYSAFVVCTVSQNVHAGDFCV